jgi:hypothetical protein
MKQHVDSVRIPRRANSARSAVAFEAPPIDGQVSHGVAWRT